MSQPSPVTSAVMVSWKARKSATVVVYKVAALTVVANLQLASSRQERYVTLPTRDVAPAPVSFLHRVLCVGRLLALVIRKRLALAPMVLALLITPLPMVQIVAIVLKVSSALAVNAQVVTFSARPSWAAILPTTIPTLAIPRRAVCPALRQTSDRMSAIPCSKISSMEHHVVEVAIVIMAIAKEAQWVER